MPKPEVKAVTLMQDEDTSVTQTRALRRARLTSLATAGAIVALTVPAMAQDLAQNLAQNLAQTSTSSDDVPRGATVINRDRPEVDPLGVRLGGFMAYPSIAAEVWHDDNVLATNTNRRNDWLTVVAPDLRLQSLWSNHALGVSAGGRFGRYADLSGQDFDDAYLRADGRLDITRANAVLARAAVNRLHEDAHSPDVPAASRAIRYNQLEAVVGYTHTFNRLTTLVEGGVEHLDYRDTATAGVPADERDRTIYTLSARGDWRMQEDYGLFGRVTGNWRNTPTAPTGGRPDRESRGWQVDGGVTFDLTGVTSGEVFVGYRQQNFRDAQLRDVRGLSFGGEIVNNFTRLTTFTLGARSILQDTTATGASAYVDNSVRLSADHELRRNILLHGSVGLAGHDYRGIDRSARRWDAGAGVTWMANRHLHLKADYTHTNHDESGAAAANDWRRNLIMLRAQVHL